MYKRVNNDKTTKEIADKHSKFLELFNKNTCTITKTCRAMNIDRSTYYYWKENYPKFAENVVDARENLIDNAERVLHKLIFEDENPTALIFFLKTQAKDRGYIEKQEIKHEGKLGVDFTDAFTDEMLKKKNDLLKDYEK